MPIPAHIPRCQYVRSNGVRCGSPSLRKRIFCYYHFKASSPPPVSCEITPVETADGIQIAIGNVLQALENDHIGVKKAIAMLYGLQTASSNLKHTNPQPAWEDVVTELGSYEQEVWHKNIATKQAEVLMERDIRKKSRQEEERRKEHAAAAEMKKMSNDQIDEMVYKVTGNTAALAEMRKKQ